jgi:hypothetical protein
MEEVTSTGNSKNLLNFLPSKTENATENLFSSQEEKKIKPRCVAVVPLVNLLLYSNAVISLAVNVKVVNHTEPKIFLFLKKEKKTRNYFSKFLRVL